MKRDFIDFEMFCGMYSTGGKTTFVGRDGERHTLTGTGDSPRLYMLDGAPIGRNHAEAFTRRCMFGKFEANT